MATNQGSGQGDVKDVVRNAVKDSEDVFLNDWLKVNKKP
jgi:hypothetical protein